MASAFKKGRKSTKKSPLGKWEFILEDKLKFESKSGRLTRIFASSAGLCERQTAGLFFLPEDFKRIRKASTEFYFKVGNTFEDIVNVAFSKADIIVDRETRIEAYHEELPVSGRIDFVIRDPDNGELVLVELKSCGKLPLKPRPGHLAQLLTYLTLTGMNRGIIWYISRSVAGWGGELIQKAFEIEPTEDEIYQVAWKIAYGAICAKDNFIPDIPSDMKRYKCGFCPLVPYCWDGDEDLLTGAKRPTGTDAASLIQRANEIASDVMDKQETLREQFIELMG